MQCITTQSHYFSLERSPHGTLTTTQTSPSLLGGVVIIGGPLLAQGCFLCQWSCPGRGFSVNGGADLYLVLYAAFRLDDLEANLNYRIGSSFDTITKDLWAKAGTWSTAFPLPLCSISCLCLYFCQWFDSASHLRRDVINVPARAAGFGFALLVAFVVG